VRRLFRKCLPLFDILLVPIAIVASLAMRMIKYAGVGRLPRTLQVFRKVGIYPISDHYFEPLINPAHLTKPLSDDRELPALDWNIGEQLELLKQFSFNDELVEIPLTQRGDLEYYYNNDTYEAGDAEFLYNMIRFYKPQRIVEIGSGFSTLLVARAIRANHRNDPNYRCEHVCIEPYEATWLKPYNATWLEKLDVTAIHQPVEQLEKSLFRELETNDILFIDSTHVIRPQGDVLFEYLEVLPIVQPGVLIHIHDIFTPKDYLEQWVCREMRLWNEQYLVEAFLSFNEEFKVIGALNFLKHHYPRELASCCPVLGDQIESLEPRSLWLRRV
jgi:predicted O-methyltransferase YrrM